MEMDFARSRIVALLLLGMSAGLFGYNFGWQRGQIAARTDVDRQLQAVQEHLTQQNATFMRQPALPTDAAVHPAPSQPPA